MLDDKLYVFENDLHFILPKQGMVISKRRIQNFEWGKYSISELTRKMKNYEVSGTANSKGYLQLSFRNTKIQKHRYIYQIFHNTQLTSKQQLDHINNDKLDNRIDNLRIVSNAENNQNKLTRIDNPTGRTGIRKYVDKNNETWYIAGITRNGVYKKLIKTQNIDLASAAYNWQAKRYNEQYGTKYVLIKSPKPKNFIKTSKKKYHITDFFGSGPKK